MFAAVRMAVVAMLLVPYGAWVLAVGLVRVVGRAVTTMRLVRDSLPCPACGAAVSTLGRWICRTCGTEYVGASVSCTYCGAHAAHYPCDRCNASVALEPWR